MNFIKRIYSRVLMALLKPITDLFLLEISKLRSVLEFEIVTCKISSQDNSLTTQKSLAEMQKTIEAILVGVNDLSAESSDRDKQILARSAQMLALYHGKSSEEWNRPLPREPKEFTFEERQ